MNFVRQWFGFNTGLTSYSDHWHVVHFSSTYHFKSGKLMRLIDQHLGMGSNLVLLDHVVHNSGTPYSTKVNHPHLYRIVVGGQIDTEALKTRVGELETAIETMQELHKPEEWLEDEATES